MLFFLRSRFSRGRRLYLGLILALAPCLGFQFCAYFYFVLDMPIPRRQVTSKTLRITFKGFEERDIEGFVQVLQWARPSMDLEFQDFMGFYVLFGFEDQWI